MKISRILPERMEARRKGGGKGEEWDNGKYEGKREEGEREEGEREEGERRRRERGGGERGGEERGGGEREGRERREREGDVPIWNGFGTSRLLPFTYSDLRYASGYLSSSTSV